MNIPFEYWLCFGLVGLYLYDSAKLIAYNQLFLTSGWRSSFRMVLPHKNDHFLKKYLCFTRPLHSTSLVFLCQWNLQNPSTPLNTTVLEQDIQNIQTMQSHLKKLSLSSGLVWLLTLVVFPILLINQQHPLYLLLLFATIYLLNIFHVLWLYLYRDRLKISKMQCLYYLIDALFCPPFALNLLKKVSLSYNIKSDAILLATELLSQDAFIDFAEQLIDDIEQLKMSENDAQSPYFMQLQQLQQQLKMQISPIA